MARNFNGTTDKIIIGDISSLNYDYNDPWSVSAWAKTSSSSGQCMLAKGKSSSDYQGWNWEFLSGGKLVFYLVNSWFSSNKIQVNSVSTYHDGTLRNYTVTYDGSTNASGVTMYVDGSSVSMSTVHDTLSSPITNTYICGIGIRNDAIIPFNGELSEVATWGAELSSNEVAALYRGVSPFSVRGSDLKGYWPMYKGGQSPEPDYGGPGNKGTVTGTTLTSHRQVELVENYI